MAIFEQGKIDEIVLKNPEERRPLFEQVAGIHRYRQQWREAERKLDQTEANLTRLGDICAEVQKQMKVLERQVKEANQFKSNKERLTQLERGTIVMRWRRADGFRQKLAKELAETHEKLSALETSSAELEKERLEIVAAVKEKQGALQALREELYRARSAKQVKGVEEQSSQKRLAEVDGRERRLGREWELLFTDREALKDQIAEQKNRRKELSNQFKQAEAAFKVVDKELAGLQQLVGKLRDQQQAVQRERIQLSERAHGLAAQVRERQVRLEHSEERIVRLTEELADASAIGEELTKGLGNREKAVKELSSEVDRHKQAVTKADADLKAQGQIVDDGQKELEEVVFELTEAQARERVLLRLKEEMEGFSAATKKLLKKMKGLKPLSEVVAADASMAAVMRPYSQTLLVKSVVELKEVWALAEKEGLTDFSLATGSFDPMDGLTLVKVTDILGGSKRNAVSKEGLYVDARGVIFSPGLSESNAFMRETELKKLSTQIPALKSRKEKLEKSIAAARKRREELVAERSGLDRDHRNAEMRLVEANFILQRCRTDLLESIERQERFTAETKELQKLKADLAREIAKLAADQQKAQEKLEARQATSDDVESGLEAQLLLLRDIGEAHAKEKAEFDRLSHTKRDSEHQLTLLENKQEECVRQEVRLKTEKEQLTQARKELTESLASFGKEMKGVDSELAKATRQLESLEKELERWQAKLDKAQERAAGGGEKRRFLSEKGHGLDVGMAQHTATCDSLAEELQERFELDMEEALKVDYKVKKSIDETEAEIRRLRREVERADHVNLAAIDEFEETAARHNHLATQTEDLETSKRELLAIIEELDTLSRTKFQETFEQVREKFQKQFAILFNGGEADLKFVGSNDVLEAGIDLVAKPPGKKMRSIKLLSGGEKCMTAMALLFAIFEVKPAPFCILDEMDAPLDDANVKRFLNVLRPFMDETQFLIITHNKLTMGVADVLYGVSMEEKGVSKQISIRFEKKEAELVSC
jgi:chromosome segregation protein